MKIKKDHTSFNSSCDSRVLTCSLYKRNRVHLRAVRGAQNCYKVFLSYLFYGEGSLG